MQLNRSDIAIYKLDRFQTKYPEASFFRYVDDLSFVSHQNNKCIVAAPKMPYYINMNFITNGKRTLIFRGKYYIFKLYTAICFRAIVFFIVTLTYLNGLWTFALT